MGCRWKITDSNVTNTYTLSGTHSEFDRRFCQFVHSLKDARRSGSEVGDVVLALANISGLHRNMCDPPPRNES